MQIIRTAFAIFILSIISPVIRAQEAELEQLLVSADFLYSNREFESAIREYQRYLFFSGSDDIDVLAKVAEGLYESGKHKLALQYYEQIYYLSDAPDVKFQSRLKAVHFHLGNQDYHQAMQELFSLKASFPEIHPEILDFLFALCYFGLEDFKKSEKHFLNITQSDSLSSQRIVTIFSDEKRFYKPNPKRLSYLSLFIPGLGQVLSREYKEGINSFILVEGIGVLAVFVAIRYSFWDAILSVLPWYQRYLIGGSDKTEKLATERRNQNRNQVFREILIELEPFRHELKLDRF